jgi:peptidoglycan hydrolase-like protein with peptidoglycan-binding domain
VTAAQMLAEARTDLGLTGRPNRITRSYSSRNGSVFLEAPWCDQGVTEWARRSGDGPAVLPGGDRAYTIWHAEDGRDLGRWYAGTAANIKAHAKPGAIIFFDWGGSDGIPYIDHVGIVERNLGDGRIQSIEANTSDAVKRRVRGPSVIAGFWNPPYVDEPATPGRPTPAPTKKWTETLMKDLPVLEVGDDNFDVKTLRSLLFARGGLAEAAYGGIAGLKSWLELTVFDRALLEDVKAFQKRTRLDVDGVVGPQTYGALLRVS